MVIVLNNVIDNVIDNVINDVPDNTKKDDKDTKDNKDILQYPFNDTECAICFEEMES